mmetsp:Transcript_2532/g.5875  ORF Transcript_2532/g.5875 Transcript_2532/m.5875 type:complete len:601 (+) Transcript_2532:28-1830(+)
MGVALSCVSIDASHERKTMSEACTKTGGRWVIWTEEGLFRWRRYSFASCDVAQQAFARWWVCRVFLTPLGEEVAARGWPRTIARIRLIIAGLRESADGSVRVRGSVALNTVISPRRGDSFQEAHEVVVDGGRSVAKWVEAADTWRTAALARTATQKSFKACEASVASTDVGSAVTSSAGRSTVDSAPASHREPRPLSSTGSQELDQWLARVREQSRRRVLQRQRGEDVDNERLPLMPLSARDNRQTQTQDEAPQAPLTARTNSSSAVAALCLASSYYGRSTNTSFVDSSDAGASCARHRSASRCQSVTPPVTPRTPLSARSLTPVHRQPARHPVPRLNFASLSSIALSPLRRTPKQTEATGNAPRLPVVPRLDLRPSDLGHDRLRFVSHGSRPRTPTVEMGARGPGESAVSPSNASRACTCGEAAGPANGESKCPACAQAQGLTPTMQSRAGHDDLSPWTPGYPFLDPAYAAQFIYEDHRRARDHFPSHGWGVQPLANPFSVDSIDEEGSPRHRYDQDSGSSRLRGFGAEAGLHVQQPGLGLGSGRGVALGSSRSTDRGSDGRHRESFCSNPATGRSDGRRSMSSQASTVIYVSPRDDRG